MSSWTYIVGNISVRMMEKTDEEAEYILKTVLKHLPKVCGSERDMEVKVVNSDVITGWSSHDEFQAWTDKSGFDEHQEFNIIINAYLRDTFFDETHRAFIKWLTRLAKRLPIDDGVVKISDGWGDNIAMVNCHPFETLYESGEENWANYMRWRYYDNYRYPKELLEKYWPEVFEEENEEEKEKTNAY